MKRFTETGKWRDNWFRRLKTHQKCLWSYVCDICDPAGVFDFDPDLFSLDIGTPITKDDLLAFGDRVEEIGPDTWVIRKFIRFQYGTLNPSCKPHLSVLPTLARHGLSASGESVSMAVDGIEPKGMGKGIAKGIHTLQEKEKDKDKEQEKETDKKPKRESNARATLDELMTFCREHGLYPRDADYLFHHWEGNGWLNNGKPIKDWRRTAIAWQKQRYLPSQKDPDSSDCWPSDAAATIEPPLDLMAELEATYARRRAEAEALATPHPEDDPGWN